jgi:hypothetical protein
VRRAGRILRFAVFGSFVLRICLGFHISNFEFPCRQGGDGRGVAGISVGKVQVGVFAVNRDGG